MLTILKHFLLTGIDGRKAIRRIAQPQPEGLRSSGLGAAPQSPQNTESVFWKRWRIPAAKRIFKTLMDGQRPPSSYFFPPDTPCPDYCLRVVAQSQLDEELPEADLIALSLPGTPETNKLFNAERFARCKDGAILINVGRGTTVDSDALVEALRSGKIFGAGLDVTDPEPLPADHPLWGEPGAIITPHNSGKFSLPKTLDNIVDIFIHNLKRYAEGLPLDNQVNRTTRYAADQNGGHRPPSTP